MQQAPGAEQLHSTSECVELRGVRMSPLQGAVGSFVVGHLFLPSGADLNVKHYGFWLSAPSFELGWPPTGALGGGEGFQRGDRGAC